MTRSPIEPRSLAADDMRDALDYAEWIQTESEARGKPLTWDAAVIAGSVQVVNRSINLTHQCAHHEDEEDC